MGGNIATTKGGVKVGRERGATGSGLGVAGGVEGEHEFETVVADGRKPNEVFRGDALGVENGGDVECKSEGSNKVLREGL